MKTLVWLKAFLEYLGGCAESPPEGVRVRFASLGWGIWWGLLACAVAVFCGQTSKFIYIDF